MGAKSSTGAWSLHRNMVHLFGATRLCALLSRRSLSLLRWAPTPIRALWAQRSKVLTSSEKAPQVEPLTQRPRPFDQIAFSVFVFQCIVCWPLVLEPACRWWLLLLVVVVCGCVWAGGGLHSSEPMRPDWQALYFLRRRTQARPAPSSSAKNSRRGVGSCGLQEGHTRI